MVLELAAIPGSLDLIRRIIFLSHKSPTSILMATLVMEITVHMIREAQAKEINAY